jgi:amphiphysin
MHDKVQSFADGKYDLNRKDLEEIYLEQRGDAAEQIEDLGITKRIASTGTFCTTPMSKAYVCPHS